MLSLKLFVLCLLLPLFSQSLHAAPAPDLEDRTREIATELRTRGKIQARKFTWRDCAKHTLLAYRNATKAEEEPPQLRRSL